MFDVRRSLSRRTNVTPDSPTLTVLGCAGGSSPAGRPTTFLIGEALGVDAGCLASALSLERQARVRHVLVSHAHVDHIRDLPLFLDNVYGSVEEPVNIYALPEVLTILKAHLFNGIVWPDPESVAPRAAAFHEVFPGKPFVIDDLEATPLLCHHGVPAAGFVIRRQPPENPTKSKQSPVHALMTDTGFNAGLFTELAAIENLSTLSIEVSFPDRLAEVARRSFHMTPRLLELALETMREAHPDLQVLVTHLKPRYREEVSAELEALDPPLRVLQEGDRLPLLLNRDREHLTE